MWPEDQGFSLVRGRKCGPHCGRLAPGGRCAGARAGDICRSDHVCQVGVRRGGGRLAPPTPSG